MAKAKEKQYNGQSEGETIQWPKRRRNNTMAKAKEKQYNGQSEGEPIHCIVSPSLWPLYCISFALAIVLFLLRFGHCIVSPSLWPLHCRNNTMAKAKEKQYNGQSEGDTIQWPTRRRNNTMAKAKEKQYNGQSEGQTIQWPSVVSPSLWSLCCLSFALAIVLSLLRFTTSDYSYGIFKLLLVPGKIVIQSEAL
jgi:hypothetical protein